MTGGTNITTVASATDTLTINDVNRSYSNYSCVVGSLTDGTATLTGGALSGVTTMAATDLTLAGNQQ